VNGPQEVRHCQNPPSTAGLNRSAESPVNGAACRATLLSPGIPGERGEGEGADREVPQTRCLRRGCDSSGEPGASATGGISDSRRLLRLLTLPARQTALFLLLAVGSAPAQAPDFEAPLIGRPSQFSRLVGRRFSIETTLEPATTIVEDPVTLRVVIKGDVLAGEEPTRKHLRIFPDDFAASFFVEPRPDDDKLNPADKTWEFVWKLRPKSIDVRELPSLALSYFAPRQNPPTKEGRFETARSKEIALDVKPRPKIVVGPTERRSAPASFLQWAEPGPAVSWEAQPRIGVVAAWMLVAGVLAAWSWRRGGVVLQRQAIHQHARRTRLGANTIAELYRESDPAPIVTRYLQARFGIAAMEPTSADIQAALKRHGVATRLREGWANWYRAAAARRFAPANPATSFAQRLNDDAIALIQRTEAT
jgi:hypothetical protein